MSNTSVKLQIANRTYPLKVDSAEQAVLEKAAEMVNLRLKEYEKAFGVRDVQDLMAMCSLHLAAEQLGYQKDKQSQEESINRELKNLCDLVKAFGKEV
ncbi:MAG: cell division protein ZapA [Bacteroidia bacterium]|nr:cell division protein ZapA [Bacteroidia bacterium]